MGIHGALFRRYVLDQWPRRSMLADRAGEGRSPNAPPTSGVDLELVWGQKGFFVRCGEGGERKARRTTKRAYGLGPTNALKSPHIIRLRAYPSR